METSKLVDNKQLAAFAAMSLGDRDATQGNVEFAHITIRGDADMTIVVSETEKKPKRTKKTHFRVVKQILMDLPTPNAATDREKTPLALMQAFSGTKTTIEVRDLSAKAFEIVMNVFHDKLRPSDYTTSVETIWELIAILQKYGIKFSTCEAWFTKCFQLASQGYKFLDNENSEQFQEAIQMLYPCWVFNNAKGFFKLSCELVYNSVHPLWEVNPTKHRDLGLPRKAMKQLNHARGRLKGNLHRGVWDIRGKLLGNHTCSHKKIAYFDHESHMVNHCRVWPMEQQFPRLSMNECLDRLDEYCYSASLDCDRCKRFPFNEHVERAVESTRTYFEGLCIDCMNKSLAPKEQYDPDRLLRACSGACRFSHGDPTSFHSDLSEKTWPHRPRRGSEPRARRDSDDSS